VTLAVALALTIAVVLTFRSRSRERRREALRAAWGVATDRIPKIDAIVESWRSRVAHTQHAAYLDDRTWTDLDLDEVFAAIDRTVSTLGQEAFYHRLRTAPLSDHLDAFEALAQRVTTDASTRERAQLAVARLQDPHGYNVWWLADPSAIESHPWYAIFPLLTISTIALAITSLVWHPAVSLFVAILAVDLGVRVAAAKSMVALGMALRQVAPLVATAQDLTFLGGDDIAPIVGTISTDATALRRLKTIARWASDDPLMLSVGASPLGYMASTFVSAVYEYVNMVLLLDGNAVLFGARDLREHRDSLLRVVAAIGDVDAALSVASWRAERDDWTRPTFTARGTRATFEDVHHPLVLEAVANSIRFEPGRGALITGSNMSGKSTFLRTIGVNAVLAQTINTCLAARYEAPVFRVQSCIGRSDDLLAGKSYYIVEVEEVLRRVRASEAAAPHLFLFDELFRGTNAIERVAAAEAVLRELVGSTDAPRPHIVLAATHDGELVDLLRDVFASYHFSDSIGEQGLTFDYRLKTGPATTRNAITLLALHGAPSSLVSRALALASAIEHQRERTIE
jgi:hypothetical protein